MRTIQVGVANFFLGQSIGVDENPNCGRHRFSRFVGV